MANPYEGPIALPGRNGHSEVFMRDQTLDLGDLQEAQRRHDELAHRDVLALSVQRRVTHFTLHFAKYASALVLAHRTGNRGCTNRVVTDSLIIALACANSLGIELDRTLRADSARSDNTFDLVELPLRYAEAVGEMAKACEAFDHPHERYPSFDVLERVVAKLTRLILLYAAVEDIDLARTVVERWRSVEAKAKASAEEAYKVPQPSVVAA